MTEKIQILITTLIHQYYTYKHYHWNYEGDMFYNYHNLFDQHASTIHQSQDEIVERVRQLGDYTKADIYDVKSYSKISISDLDKTSQKDLKKILDNLLTTHKEVISLMESIIVQADEAKDYSTADMLTKYLEEQQKMEWFIRSSSR